jgi:carboxypeptidase Taq
MKHYKNLEKKFERIGKLSHLLSIVSWDEQVNMPQDSGDSRAQAMAEGYLMVQELQLDPALEDLAKESENEAKDNKLTPWQEANLKLIHKKIKEAKAVPSDLNHGITLAVMKCQQAWPELRKKNDWKSFLPLFDPVVKLSREAAVARGEAFSLSPYNALLAQYQEGLDSEHIDKTFNQLKTWHPKLLDQARGRSSDILQPNGSFPVPNQKSLGIQVMSALGFDFNRGRLDVSHHPFCGGVSTDVRMTTRYSEDDFSQSLMGIIHETGHGLYELGLPREFEFQPAGNAAGMMLHESQSLLFEMQLGRSLPFLKFLSPMVKQHFGSDPALQSENLQKIYLRVAPGLIRVDADEVSYPAHVVLRYEIEKRLMEGAISTADIPMLWDEKMKSYLDLDTKGNYKDGCMQDVHWPGGSFGYFPCYTLGAMLAAQFFKALKRDLPGLNASVESGDFTPIRSWLETHVWSKGSSQSPTDLIKNATGKELSDSDYRAHLEERYLS